MFLSAIFLKIALTIGLNCTPLRLEQLLTYCRAIFFQIALKPVWLAGRKPDRMSLEYKKEENYSLASDHSNFA